MVELLRFYLTWLIYIIGTVKILLISGIQNDCIVCDLFEIKIENQDK